MRIYLEVEFKGFYDLWNVGDEREGKVWILYRFLVLLIGWVVILFIDWDRKF